MQLVPWCEAREYAQPVFHPVLALDLRRAVNQPGLLRLQTMLFEHRRVLTDAGVIPGSLDRPQHRVNSIDNRLNVSVPAKLGDETPAWLEGSRNARRSAVRV